MKKYENLIREKANDQPIPYWFRLGKLQGENKILPHKIIKALAESATAFFPDCKITCDSMFTEHSILHIWSTVVGANASLLYNHFNYNEQKEYNGNFGEWIIELRDELISFGSSMETDNYESCTLTHVILESYGCNEEMIKEEINYILDQGYLTQRDFDFLDLIISNYDISICKKLYYLFEKSFKLNLANAS